MNFQELPRYKQNLLLEESVSAILTHHSNTDYMNSSFKVHFMLSEFTLGFIFIEEIEPQLSL